MPSRQLADSRGRKGLTVVLYRAGKTARSQELSGFVDTRTPVPPSTLVHSHLAGERYARPAPPMPGKETDAISIADCQTSLASLPQS